MVSPRTPPFSGSLNRPAARAAYARTGVVLLAVVAWAAATRFGWVDQVFLSTPLHVAQALVGFASDPEVVEAFLATIRSIVLAFLIGTSLGVVVGSMLGLSQILKDAYMKPVLFLLSTPKSMFLPIFLLLFGIRPITAIAFGAFSTFFYVVVNVVGGVELVEPGQLRLARAFRASRWRTYVDIVIPASMPGLFAAFWHGITHAVSGTLLAQLFVSIGGLGALMRFYTSTLQTEKALGVIVVVSALAIGAGAAWNHVERRMTHWRSQSKAMELP